mgnify:CR=1 FL=1
MKILRLKRFLRQLSRKTYLTFFIILVASFCLIFQFTYKDNYFNKNFSPTGIELKKDFTESRFFYENIEKKVNRYRSKIASEQLFFDKKLEYEKPWYKAQTPVEISINVENMSRINEDLSHIRIEGTINARWDKQSSFSNIIPGKLGKFTQRAINDFLKDSNLNFTSAEEQKFTKVGDVVELVDDQESYFSRISTYKFEGNFPLIRDLRKFPFDKAIWEIELSHPLNAAIFFPEYKHKQNNNIPNSVNAYQVKKIKCPDSTENNYCSSILIKNYNSLKNPRTFIKVYGNLGRSPTASFHRFILPIVFGIIVLALVDQVNTQDKWDIKLTTPPTILLTFIFLQTGYHSQLEQISYLTYLDQIYLIGYLSCILMLINAIINKGDWFKKRTNRIKRIKFTRNIRLTFLFINIVLPFLLYFIF